MSNKPEIYIEKDKLVPNPLNHFPISDLTDLKNTIEQFGILSPLSVVGPYDDGTYRIISGHRRYASWCELCKEGRASGLVPYYVVGDKNMTEREQYIRILISNIEAREENTSNVYKAELLEVLRQMAVEGEFKEQAISRKMAEYMKTSTRYARYWTRVFGSDNEELKELVRDNKLSIKNASKIVGMTEEEQAEAITAVKNGEKLPAGLLHAPNKPTSVNGPGTQQEGITGHHQNEADFSDKTDVDKASSTKVEDDEAPKTLSDLLKKGNFTVEELDKVELSVDDLLPDPDINLTSDTTGRVGELFADDNYGTTPRITAKEREDAKTLQTVISWCEKIKTVTEPTAEEWNAIQQCIEVAELFSY